MPIVDVTISKPEEDTEGGKIVELKPSVFMRQAEVDRYERWRTANAFGDMNPSTLSSILKEVSSDGELGRWGDLCVYMQKTWAHLKSVFNTRTQRVVQCPFVIRPPKGVTSDQAEPAARICREVVETIPKLDELMSKSLTAIGVGVSAVELDWDYDPQKNLYTISGFSFVHPHRLHYGNAWEVRLYDEGQRDPANWGEALRQDKWLVHVAASDSGYPGDAGLFQTAAWPWLFRQWFRKFHVHGVETRGVPLIYGEVPRGAKADVVNELLSAISNLSYDTRAVVREGTKLTALAGSDVGTGEVYTRALDACDSEVTKLFLGAEDIVTPGTHGSQSAVEERTSATLDPRTVSDAKLWAADFRKYVLTSICRLNFHHFGGKLPPIPEMVFGGEAAEEGERTPEIQGEQEGGEGKQPPTESESGAGLAPDQAKTLLDIIERVNAGSLPRANAIELIVIAFPAIDRARAELLLGSTGADKQISAQETPVTSPPATPPPAMSAIPESVAVAQANPAMPAKKASARGKRAPSKQTPTTVQTGMLFPSPTAKTLLGE